MKNIRALMGYLLCVGGLLAGQAWANPAIFRASDQSPVTRDMLINALQRADVVILGELHDNPHHHQIRGELIRAIARPGLRVVAEHMTLSQRVEFSAGLLPALKAAGFAEKAWAWPVHEPLFAAIQASGLPLLGANLTAEESSQAFKTLGGSLPDGLKDLLHRASLTDSQRQALERELMQSHCGALPQSMLPGMLWAQRARDAAMAFAATASLPSVLVAGNGHAWRDVGVPQIVQFSHPQLTLVSVLFSEHDRDAQISQRQQLNDAQPRADYVWFTEAADRPDPCLAFKKK